MKRQLSLLAVALLLAQPVLAKDTPLNRAAALANSVTPAASSRRMTILSNRRWRSYATLCRGCRHADPRSAGAHQTKPNSGRYRPAEGQRL